jgi:hypothetical protein
MDRRETIKTMLIGSVAGGFLLTGCQPGESNDANIQKQGEGYGRTSKEEARDLKLQGEVFFSEHELATIAVLCDLILPATSTEGSAKDAGVPEFISFIARDIKDHQLPLRGGLMWLDHRAMTFFEKSFMECDIVQQKKLLDEIAYPETASPELQQGVSFFNRMRGLLLTGYYTTRMGIDELGYQGNTPNVWDGVPEEVLKKHGKAYDSAWLSKCVDQEKRGVLAEWDADGNLIS